MRWLWLCLSVLLTLTGCMKKPMAEVAYTEESYDDEMMDEADAEPSAAFGRSAPRAKRSAAPRSPAAPSIAPPADEPVAPDKPAEKRMIAYEGSTTLRVARIRPAVDAITATVQELGGFVERVDGARMVVRVPVARFREALIAVQAAGDIVDERIFANDVTEAFQDVQLRLQTAEATRERLVELLAMTEDENTKLMLIREIQRLTDQIDQMTAQAGTLKRLADLSRITVQLVEREALARQGAGAESQVFAWIRALSPFGSDIVRSGRYLGLDVPEGMVGLDLWREYVAEAPDGSRIWSGRLDTELQADSAFWAEAIQGRLAEDFASAEVSTLGAYVVVTFTSRTDTPYTWIVAVRADHRRLHIVEAYLSSPEQAERFLPAVRAVIAADGGAA